MLLAENDLKMKAFTRKIFLFQFPRSVIWTIENQFRFILIFRQLIDVFAHGCYSYLVGREICVCSNTQNEWVQFALHHVL